jgi:hypothetical protein
MSTDEFVESHGSSIQMTSGGFRGAAYARRRPITITAAVAKSEIQTATSPTWL